MAVPKDITTLNRYELWVPGSATPDLTLYNLMEPPKKTLSRLAAFKSPTYGGRPDITKQYAFPFFTWEIVTMLNGVGVLKLEKLVKVLDELALSPTQQWGMLKDFFTPTSLVLRPDLTNAVISTLPDTAPASGLAPIVLTAHNIIITGVSYERVAIGLEEPNCLTTLTIQEVV